MEKMNRVFTVLVLILMTMTIQAQSGNGVGIGTVDVDSDAALEIDNDSKGVLLPRVTTKPGSAANGMILYDNVSGKIEVREQGVWKPLIPRGVIVMWSGVESTVPTGWELCDGDNGTPNLSGKFIVAYDAGNTDYDDPGNRSIGGTNPGEEGGAASVPLQSSHMPSHRHGLSLNHNHSITISVTGGSHSHVIEEADGTGGRAGFDYRTGGSINNRSTEISSSHVHGATGNIGNSNPATVTSFTGGSSAHENRPQYYVLAFIMKL